MSILVVGVNHRTCPLSVLERVRINVGELPAALATLRRRDDVRECVVVSTCHRTEVYVVAERFHGAFGAIRDFLVEHSGLGLDEIHPHLVSDHDSSAVDHLLRVVGGLDSLLIGESEILGQVRRAWTVASGESASGPTLNLLFRHALATGKRVRTETRIGRETTSLSHAAVDLAVDRLGDLAGRTVLVLGAGEMGRGIVTALATRGVGQLLVSNRNVARAADLASGVGGRPLTADAGRASIGTADLLLTVLGGDAPRIDRPLVERALLERAHAGVTSPLLIIDIAVPRNVDRAVGDLPGVELLDLDDLRRRVDRGRSRRSAEVGAAEAVIAEAAERFALDLASREAAPLVAQLHELGASICTDELERHARLLVGLDDRAMAAVASIAHGVAAKLLHHPSVRLKRDAGTPSGSRNAAAIRDLFALDDRLHAHRPEPDEIIATMFVNPVDNSGSRTIVHERSMVSGASQEVGK